MNVAVVNQSTQLSDTDLAFYVAGCNTFLLECVLAWGVHYTPVSLYRSTYDLPAGLTRVATFVDELPDAPGALAFHSVNPDGSVYSMMRADAGSVGLDHEDVEELLDPDCAKTVTRPDGKAVAYEIADPVQADTRARSVTVLGETRQVQQSNYVLSAWFDPNGKAPFDAFGLCVAPFEIRPGGYCIVDGEAVFGEGDEIAKRAVEAKRADPGSRVARRLAVTKVGRP
jgi:hypothetical protein